MTVKNSDILTAARRLISDPKNWTTDGLARDRKGTVVHFQDPFACSWCAAGAALRAAKVFGVRVSNDDLFGSLDAAVLSFRPSVFDDLGRGIYRPIIALNDRNKDHAAVLRAYDLAIEAEKAREFAEEIERTGKDDA